MQLCSREVIMHAAICHLTHSRALTMQLHSGNVCAYLDNCKYVVDPCTTVSGGS
jgi:hypothetical protein